MLKKFLKVPRIEPGIGDDLMDPMGPVDGQRESEADVSVEETSAADSEVISEPQVSLPDRIFIGYYAHIKKSDLVKYVRGYAATHCNAPKTARYQIRRYQSGYLYELHDGGNAGGVLSSLIRALEQSDVVVVPMANRRIRVVYNAGSITSFLLNEGDESAPTPGISHTDRLEPLTRSGTGTFSLGVLAFILGFGVFATGSVVNFLASTQAARPDFQVSEKRTPLEGLHELGRQKPGPAQYIDRLEFRGNGWEVRFKSKPAPSTKEHPEVDEMQRLLEREKVQ